MRKSFSKFNSYNIFLVRLSKTFDPCSRRQFNWRLF